MQVNIASSHWNAKVDGPLPSISHLCMQNIKHYILQPCEEVASNYKFNMTRSMLVGITPSNSPNRYDVKDGSGHVYSLVRWDDLPHWQQDNQYIHGSYRRPSGSYKRSFISLFHIHNETVNIYTHLLPALATVPAAFSLYKIFQLRYARATSSDVFAFSFFFFGICMCLGASATYHTISNHSPRVNRLGNQLDYIGIILLITGSFIPSIYYGFWCHPNLQMAYWTMVGICECCFVQGFKN